MKQFIDTHFEKITWILILSGLIVFFFEKQYVQLVLLLSVLVNIVKYWKQIVAFLHTTPFNKKFIYVFGMVILIVSLTTIMQFSSYYITVLNVSVWLQYVYVFIVLKVGIISYSIVTNRIIRGLKKQ